TASKIPGAMFADRAEVFEDEADGVETAMTAGAALVIAVPGEQLRQRQLTQLRLVLRQFGDRGRRWRNVFAQQPANNPIAALDRAGAQSRSVFGEKDRHGQQRAAAIAVGVF